MNSRERFNLAMRFKRVDRLPILYTHGWPTTVLRWKQEGMTSEETLFPAFDGPMQSCWMYGESQGPLPAFEETVLEENDDHSIVRNYLGQKVCQKKNVTSMPHFLEYPIRSRKDWQNYRKRLDPYSPGRYPDNWETLVQERKTIRSGEIRGVACWGFYGFPREMIGPETLSLMFYDDPGLILEMNEFWADFTIKRLERAVTEMAFDYALIWEDNCYNHGMLHSPRIFREFMAPGYRKLVDFFKGHDIDIISVDSDGNVLEFIPLLLDVGVTGVHPFEVAAGMDVVKIGRQYPGLQIWGGLDKRALAKDKTAIDKELRRVILPMKKRGGYAASLDHGVPSDVSFENYLYYVKRLQEISIIDPC